MPKLLLIKHSFALIREDKLYSAIYIAGTAVAIASAMVIAIVLHTMVADITPGVNRSRTLYVSSTYHHDLQTSPTQRWIHVFAKWKVWSWQQVLKKKTSPSAMKNTRM